MRRELSRAVKTPSYFAIIGGGIIVRATLAYLDRLYHEERFWDACASFWAKIGGLTMAALILVCLIRLFSLDYECGTKEILTSTPYGRKRLFWLRLSASVTGAVIGVLTLAFANILISLSFGLGLKAGSPWLSPFLSSTAIALCGCTGLTVVAGAVCDISKSQPVALCVCGVPFIVSLFINSGVIKPLEPLWFIRFGFFSELMRGRALASLPGFWVVWYGAMLIAAVAFAIRKRRERKEL